MAEPKEYEASLNDGTDLWIREASEYFERSGALYKALANIVRALHRLNIPYALCGALALGEHGYRRLTEDIDLLLTSDGLDRFHSELVGLGYRPAFPGARKKFRDTETGVKIDVLKTGEYPGDGKPKSVVFPDPFEASEESHGLRVLKLEKLIELKLASGMTSPTRLHDLADIQDLIKVTHLSVELADKLDESVREKYRELWHTAQIKDVHDE